MSRVARARFGGAILAAAIAVAGSLGTAASAATVLLQDFAATDVAGARAARDAFMAGTDAEVFGAGGQFGAGTGITAHRTETFAGFQAWNGTTGTTNPAGTDVGSFTTLGGVGTGRSAINGGAGVEVRGENPFEWGRHSVLNPGSAWLDSNDTYGIRWEVGGLGAFNALTFFLTDVADAGAKFSLRVGDSLHENIIGAGGRTANGTIHWVRILLDEAVSDLVVELRHDRLNDGFGIDGMTVAHISSVPVPPAAALMLTGGLMLVALRRRQAKQAA